MGQDEGGRAPRASTKIGEVEKLDVFRLTAVQQGILAESLVGGRQGTYVEQVIWEWERPPHPERLRAAWQAALDAFEGLRLGFEWPNSGKLIQQVVRSGLQASFRVRDFTGTEQPARLERFLAEDRAVGFDVFAAPLWRVSLLTFSPARAVCVWTIHHSIVDAASFALVLREVMSHYDGATSGRVPRTLPGRPQFGDFLRWLERHDPAPGLRYFTELLRGFAEPTALPLQSAGSRGPTSKVGQVRFRLQSAAAHGLRTLASETATSPNAVVQLGWAFLLARYAGKTDVVFGATWSGRPGTIEGAAEVVGPCINTLPVRVSWGDGATVRGVLTALRAQHLETRPFQHTALVDIKARSEVTQSPQLFQSLVVFEYQRFSAKLTSSDPRWSRHSLSSRSQAGYPLVLEACFAGAELELELEYDADLYSVAVAARLLSDYARILTSIAEHLDQAPSVLPVLDPARRRQLTTGAAERELVPDPPLAITHILAQAKASPNRVALREVGGAEIRYQELEQRVLGVAGSLRRKGVGPGTLVAVWASRSIETVILLLAVQATGAAFVFIDPNDPPRRVEHILRDSGVMGLVVSGQTRGRPGVPPELELDIEAAAGEPEPVELSESPTRLDALAYVIYTSGSTGEPKGVRITQRALGHHVAAMAQYLALAPGDRVLQFAALTFDVALEELLPSLAVGATVVFRSSEMSLSARAFFDGVAAEALSVLNLPSAFWHELVQAGARWPACVRLVIVGGERVSAQAHQKFRAADTRHIRWVNGYGPTETTITSTCYDDAEGDHDFSVIPIGRPLPGVSHFVLDERLEPVPEGTVGQLFIGGVGLALGYLNREQLTRERFVDHPFRAGARLYATGDYVRTTPAGNYVFVDRVDAQLKVRGFRIELGEIEASLRRFPGVSDAAVVLSTHAEEGLLVGFVTTSPDVTEARLRVHLMSELPAHMVPWRILGLEGLPTTSSGKVDRRALAERCARLEPSASVAELAPDDALHATLLQIWTEVLGAPIVDTTKSFFDLGGHSLLLVRMFSEVEQRLGRSCNVSAFYVQPTIRRLAELLRASDGLGRGAVELSPGSPQIMPIFFAPGLTGREMDFMNLARALPAEVPVHALQFGATRFEPGADTLASLARRLVDVMQTLQPHGPYAIAGYSAGGVFAVVMVQEIIARGETVDFVGLIDCVPPSSVPVLSPWTSPQRMLRLSRTVVGRVQEILDGPRALPTLWTRARSAAQRGAARWNIGPWKYEPAISDYFGAAPGQFSERDMENMQRYLDAVEAHRFDAVEAELVLFRTPLDPPEGPHERDLGWGRVTSGRVVVEELSGGHAQLITAEGCHELAARLASYLTRRAKLT